LLAGEKAGSKLAKAKELNIPYNNQPKRTTDRRPTKFDKK